jgi:hypothetical protein
MARKLSAKEASSTLLKVIMKKALILVAMFAAVGGAQAAITVNALSNNALSNNALSNNALSNNALTNNAVAVPAPQASPAAENPLTTLSRQSIAQ